VDEGIVAFKTFDEAAEGVRAVEGDWHRHARAARAIAEEYFDSRKIVSRIVEQAATARPAIPSGGVIGVSF